MDQDGEISSRLKETTSDDTSSHNTLNDKDFICGVVEGFYGRPWTFSQRKDLFKRLKDFRLNAFMYAPKDDIKHRAKWRDLYNEVEATELKSLIDESESQGICFYYSLAPGLDMTYSSEEDMNIIKRKFDQLRRLGCKSFAILFDDIEPRVLNEKDKSIYSDNYAQAQVDVSNSIFDYLGEPKFLFCPTEYCESRANPSIKESLYLKTIGSGLHRDIDFMWSGSRVISRFITVESIMELSEVIKRPPVIWENLHANDYDKKRIFLGPYSGRSTKIIPLLRGVLTNPNCEYEANYIAIHTLAQWSRCTKDVNQNNRCNQRNTPSDPPMNSQQNELQKTTPLTVSPDIMYDPDCALVCAIRDWLPHVLSARSLPDGSEYMHLTQDMHSDSSAAEMQLTKELDVDVVDVDSKRDNNEVDMPTDDSLSKGVPIGVDEGSNGSSGGKTTTSDMDTSPGASNNNVMLESNTGCGRCDANEGDGCLSDAQMIDPNSCDSCEMQEDSNVSTTTDQRQTSDQNKIASAHDAGCIICSANNSTTNPCTGNNNNNPSFTGDSHGQLLQKVDLDSLTLLVDLFYLPFEHGIRGHALLSDIKWLIDNSSIFITEDDEDDRNSDSSQMDEEQCSLDTNNKTTNEEFSRERDSKTKSPQPLAKVDSKLVEKWVERASRLNNLCNSINRILITLIHGCPNKLIIIELYPYMAELRDVIHMIVDYIRFLQNRRSTHDQFYYSSGSKRHSDNEQQVTPGEEQEPWVHRGGLIGDMQRLIT